jgi:anti-sigma regulatory factor (Ser/Thr protein kinase)
LANGESVLPLLGNDEFADLDVVYQTMMRQIVRQQQLNSRLQNMLLPQQLPAFDGIRIDTAYVPAAQETQVGGDWYDAFTIGERRICISIGDVAGHGLRAAAIMASVRLAVRTAARMQDDPAKIVAHLNRVICADEPDTLVTALVATLDIDDGTLSYAVAGHPEPMLIDSDRRVQLLAGRGLVLGADPNATYETFNAQLHEGWALLLYTDGLIEVAGDYFKGVDDLRSAASEEAASSTQNIAEAIQQRVFHGRRADDDAAVLFIGVTRLGLAAQDRARRSWTLDATDAESAHRAKRAILWHLGDAIRDEAHLASIELVLGELIGNVARHSPGLAEVTLERQDSRTVLRVCDRGKPFEATPTNGSPADLLAESGRGLFIVRSMSQNLRIEHNGTGNVITAVLA